MLSAAEALREADGAHPALYAPVVEQLKRLFSADFVAASLWDERAGRYIQSFSSGRDESIAASYERFQGVDPFRRVIRMRAGRATCLSRAIPASDLRHSAYYTDHLSHYALEDGVEMALLDGASIIGDFRVWRGRGIKPMGVHDELMMELLGPSVLKALQHYRLMLREAAPEISSYSTHSEVHLTPREKEILDLLASGSTDKAIARQLGMSYWTVRTHVSALLRKMDVGNRTEAVARGRWLTTEGARSFA